ncbi:MAG: leucine-rich repeat domain-containing protein [Bacteroidales bacterium]|nr:leucine-rich repeat domain-containing protein [Bacteroidales bacterium]
MSLSIMDIKTLYNDLIKAFSNENLNIITGKLIMLYKNKNYSKIDEIVEKISDIIPINEEKNAKRFSKLIMLYHPDKGEQVRREINDLYQQNNYDQLHKYAHILLIGDIDKVIVDELDDDIDYHPEFGWDLVDTNGFTYRNFDDDNEQEFDNVIIDYERSFFNLIKIREYGRVDIELPSYYLENFEEFELAYSGLETLDGVEYCIHARTLDVSNNSLTELGNLWYLKDLEELYLGNNEIGYIDALSNLSKLKVLDLSGNVVDDISPLLKLVNLEHVNLIGNPVSEHQVDLLEAKGITVISEKVQAHSMFK